MLLAGRREMLKWYELKKNQFLNMQDTIKLQSGKKYSMIAKTQQKLSSRKKTNK